MHTDMKITYLFFQFFEQKNLVQTRFIILFPSSG